MTASLPLSHVQQLVQAELGGVLKKREKRECVAHDVYMLLARVRPVLLWDYCAVGGIEAQHGGYQSAGRCVQMFELDHFVLSINAASSEQSHLRSLVLGSSLLLVNEQLLREQICRDLSNSFSRLQFVAIDNSLSYPRPSTQSERSHMVQQLSSVAEALQRLLARGRAEDDLTLMHGDGLLRAGAHSLLLMIPLHAWLLCYPVAYCFVTAAIELTEKDANTCLSAQLLRVSRVSVSVAEQREDGRLLHSDHIVQSFSCPTCLAEAEPFATHMKSWWEATRKHVEGLSATAGLGTPVLSSQDMYQEVAL
eukprot:6189019-Pleurochrysis_carterae.AAC.4